VIATLTFITFKNNFDFSHTHLVYYFIIYKFWVYYMEIFIYFHNIYLISNILNKYEPREVSTLTLGRKQSNARMQTKYLPHGNREGDL
jgi:hypothetical protein